MAIYNPKNSKTSNWYIDFIDPNGKRIRQSAGTENKAHAQELHDRLKSESWRVKNVGEKPRYSWQQAVVRWMNEHQYKKSLRTDKQIFRYLNQHLHDKNLDEINKRVIDAIKAHKLSMNSKPATVNRMLSLLRGVLIAAHREWEWIDNRPNVKLMTVKNERIRWLTHDEVARLFAELPPHTLAMARFSLATGLRASNVIHLKWSNVDLQKRCAWIDASESKSGKAIAVPLNDDAMAALHSQLEKHESYVFVYAGKPVNIVGNITWRNAVKRAGIEDFRYHDLRHTWASWHVQNGTPLHILKELGGWSDLKMVLRYAHLSSESLSGYANNSKVNDKILTYPQKSAANEARRRA